jgi:SAM-dependent methyltransferase
MIPLVRAALPRERFHGLRQIVRFNWPYYAAGMTAAAAAPPIAALLPVGGEATLGVAYCASALAWLWILGSLAASWIVYDRSSLMAGTWIREALGYSPRAWISIHAGFDEMTPVLRGLFAKSAGRGIDIYDPVEMTEGSIARARRITGGGESERARFTHLPAADESIDVGFALLSAHELRSHGARVALFAELHRVVKPGGRVVVAEHLRDVPNFVAFGPGFFHFHSRRAWARCFSAARFGIFDEFAVTPFVRVFILRRLP